MKRSQHKQAMVALFLLGIMALAIVFVYAQTISISKTLMEKKSGAKTEESINQAVDSLKQGVVSASEKLAKELYSSLLATANLSEDETYDTLDTRMKSNYYKQYIDRLESLYGEKCISVSDTLSMYLPDDQRGVFSIATELEPELLIDYNESTCEIASCYIRNVMVRYMIDDTVIKEKVCDIEIPSPEVVFSDEKIDYADYCIIGAKGIYVTGETSSIVGNIYAGVHEYEEGREAEIIYGEKDPYGGFNVLTTQLGIFADDLVSVGDVNLKGAFVLFGSEEDKVTIYANTINDIENYPSKTEYTINGETYLRDGATEFINDEHYQEITRMMNDLKYKISNIGDYYDTREATVSENEESSVKYTKIISDSDITLTENFTGVLITKGNVIVENGCNVEGMIIAGDRIYIYGNNNIVSNKELVEQIIADEENSAFGAASDMNHHISYFLNGTNSQQVVISE